MGQMFCTFWERGGWRRRKGKTAPREHIATVVRFGFLMAGSALKRPWVPSAEDKFCKLLFCPLQFSACPRGPTGGSMSCTETSLGGL